MFLNRVILVLCLLLPLQAWSAFDIEEIKNNISNNQSFAVSQWIKKDDENSWHATTSNKRMVISVDENNATFITPYINSRQKIAAKALCAEFGVITTQSTDKTSQLLIKKAILGATTRHKIKYLTLNNVKFSVTPKLIGAVVSLHCESKTQP